MLHSHRTFCVRRRTLAEVQALGADSWWTLCTAFNVTFDGLEVLFLADGGGEFAVAVQDASGDWLQIESYTLKWVKSEERLRELLTTTITDYRAGKPTMRANLGPLTLDHGVHSCTLCR